MTAPHLKRLAKVNPVTPEFDRLNDDEAVTFTPLECIWPDGDADFSRRRPKKEVETGYTRYRDGDVLLPKVTPTFQAGRVAIAAVTTPAAAGTTELHVLRSHPGHDSRYLAYLCRSEPFLQEGVAAFQGVAGLQRVPEDFVATFRVPVTSSSEQRRIADHLDAECAHLDQLIALRLDQSRLLDEKTDVTVLRSLLPSVSETSTLDELMGRLPPGWSVGRLKDVASRIDVGIAEAATHAYADSGVPLIRSTNIRPGRIDTGDLLHITSAFAHRNRAKTVRAGDILTVRTGSPGVSAVVPESLGGCQTFTQLITTVSPSNAAEYVCAWLNAPHARSYFESFAWGSAQRNISVPILANAPVLIPPKPDQLAALRRLHEELAPVTTARDLLVQSTTLLRERRQALITAAVTGQVDLATAGQVA